MTKLVLPNDCRERNELAQRYFGQRRTNQLIPQVALLGYHCTVLNILHKRLL